MEGPDEVGKVAGWGVTVGGRQSALMSPFPTGDVWVRRAKTTVCWGEGGWSNHFDHFVVFYQKCGSACVVVGFNRI